MTPAMSAPSWASLAGADEIAGCAIGSGWTLPRVTSISISAAAGAAKADGHERHGNQGDRPADAAANDGGRGVAGILALLMASSRSCSAAAHFRRVERDLDLFPGLVLVRRQSVRGTACAPRARRSPARPARSARRRAPPPRGSPATEPSGLSDIITTTRTSAGSVQPIGGLQHCGEPRAQRVELVRRHLRVDRPMSCRRATAAACSRLRPAAACPCRAAPRSCRRRRSSACFFGAGCGLRDLRPRLRLRHVVRRRLDRGLLRLRRRAAPAAAAARASASGGRRRGSGGRLGRRFGLGAGSGGRLGRRRFGRGRRRRRDRGRLGRLRRRRRWPAAAAAAVSSAIGFSSRLAAWASRPSASASRRPWGRW